MNSQIFSMFVFEMFATVPIHNTATTTPYVSQKVLCEYIHIQKSSIKRVQEEINKFSMLSGVQTAWS